MVVPLSKAVFKKGKCKRGSVVPEIELSCCGVKPWFELDSLNLVFSLVNA